MDFVTIEAQPGIAQSHSRAPCKSRPMGGAGEDPPSLARGMDASEGE
ncbi:MAG TPA: hypothetical protein VMO26_08720 [Vicinamibacterales bacterium]|nr:hypothetical protein [Vicinamibacterales bacterium]